MLSAHQTFLGIIKDYKLQYRGRLDASRKETAPEDSKRELFEAMKLIGETNHGPQYQVPSSKFQVPSSKFQV